METRNRVRECRLQEGLAQAELARLAGLADRTVRDIENGRTNARPDTEYKILKAFNSRPDKLRDYTHEYLFPNGL